jgi:hypothetical protein
MDPTIAVLPHGDPTIAVIDGLLMHAHLAGETYSRPSGGRCGVRRGPVYVEASAASVPQITRGGRRCVSSHNTLNIAIWDDPKGTSSLALPPPRRRGLSGGAQQRPRKATIRRGRCPGQGRRRRRPKPPPMSGETMREAAFAPGRRRNGRVTYDASLPKHIGQRRER